ncbi:MAG: HAMP domain-containing sensor histidine kinase [Alphaproteobacteria bacterium]
MVIRSLALRLVVGAGAWIAVALLAGGIALSALFRDYVEQSFDARLVLLLESLVAVSERDGEGLVHLSRGVGEPRFDQPLSGWYWQISDGARSLLRSRSLWDEALPASNAPATAEARRRDIEGPEGQRLRVVERDIALPGSKQRLRFVVAGDRGEIDASVRGFNAALAWSLGLLGVGLLVALLIQVRFGLRPLRRIRQAIIAVRGGRAERLEGEFPVEIAPLSDELNVLLAHNAGVLERARTQVSNLAHALKTPLSVLVNESSGADGPLAENVRRQAAIMRRQIDHHLSRARTAATARVLGARTGVAAVAEDLRRTLARIHVDRPIDIEMRLPAGLWFRGERQDLEEMLGNLADNACKWARGRVLVTGRRDGDRVVCVVEDDGPGLPEAQRDAVFDRGRRLDESVPGTGHGLAIVREVAELYGGSISLERSSLGGLRAILYLPAAAD